MTMPKLPRTLVEAARSGRLVPFVGAGVSMAVYRTDGTRAFPSWAELLDASAERVEEEGHPEHSQAIRALLRLPKPDFFDIAKRARDVLGLATWRRFLVEQLAPARAEIADDSLALAKAIWALGSKLVITTNYDRVLSWACPRADDLRPWRFQSEGDLVDLLGGRLERPSLWQLHGSIDEPTQLILTPDGYRELYGDDSQKPRHEAALTGLRNTIAGHHLLFVGFSLDDDYIARQFDWVCETFRGCDGPHYVLVRVAEFASMREKLGGTGIQAISFDGFGGPLLDLLHQLATTSDAVALPRSVRPGASVSEGDGGTKAGSLVALDPGSGAVPVTTEGGPSWPDKICFHISPSESTVEFHYEVEGHDLEQIARAPFLANERALSESVNVFLGALAGMSSESLAQSRAKSSVIVYANPPDRQGQRIGRVYVTRTMPPLRHVLRGKWAALEACVFVGGRRWLFEDLIKQNRVDLFITLYEDYHWMKRVEPLRDTAETRDLVDQALRESNPHLERLVAEMLVERCVKIRLAPAVWSPESHPETGEDAFEVTGIISD